jgi:hypothetical protein
MDEERIADFVSIAGYCRREMTSTPGLRRVLSRSMKGDKADGKGGKAAGQGGKAIGKGGGSDVSRRDRGREQERSRGRARSLSLSHAKWKMGVLSSLRSGSTCSCNRYPALYNRAFRADPIPCPLAVEGLAALKNSSPLRSTAWILIEDPTGFPLQFFTLLGHMSGSAGTQIFAQLAQLLQQFGPAKPTIMVLPPRLPPLMPSLADRRRCRNRLQARNRRCYRLVLSWKTLSCGTASSICEVNPPTLKLVMTNRQGKSSWMPSQWKRRKWDYNCCKDCHLEAILPEYETEWLFTCSDDCRTRYTSLPRTTVGRGWIVQKAPRGLTRW